MAIGDDDGTGDDGGRSNSPEKRRKLSLAKLIVLIYVCGSSHENALFRPLLNLPQIPRPCASFSHLHLGTKST